MFQEKGLLSEQSRSFNVRLLLISNEDNSLLVHIKDRLDLYS